MTPRAHTSALRLLIVAAITQIARRPYLSLSVVVHAGLLALLYYFGSYQPELRQQEAEVASSLRATSLASTAKRLQDLQTIKQLLEKSADRLDTQPEPSPDPSAPPQTPEEMVERARELSQAIDALDEEIKAEELAKLIDEPEAPPAASPPQAPAAEERVAGNEAVTEPREQQSAPDSLPPQLEVKANDRQADVGHENDRTKEAVTPEKAASEVATLEAKARATLAKRQQRLEARANGVQVEGSGSDAGAEGAGAEGAGAEGAGAEGAGAQGAGAQGAGAKGAGAQGAGSKASVRAEIADFIRGGESIDQATGPTGYSGTNFFNGGNSEIPAVDASTLVRGRGRMIGAGGEYANRLYLNSWYTIGPFPGRHGVDLFDNPSYPPEKAVLLDAVYFGKDKRLLQWRYVTSQEYPFYPPDMAEDSVYYGYTEVSVDQACDLTAWIGVDDDVQIYFNDQLVWQGGNVSKRPYFDAIFNNRNTYLRDYNRTEGKRVLHFNKGRNRIFFKMSNGPNKAFLSMVLTR
jgi:hypothetical protein